MYIKSGLIKLLKIKNIILFLVGIFELAFSVEILADLYGTYSNDMETFWSAKATPQCIHGIIYGIVALIICTLSTKMIGDAIFYSRNFELELTGYIKFDNLANVVGKNKYVVMLELTLYRFFYMKKFSIKTVDKTKQVVLNSKSIACECRYCGAPIDKSIYFTGSCSYCGSSDLFAKVIADDRFYSIENDLSEQTKSSDFYKNSKLGLKLSVFAILIGLLSAFVVIAIMMMIDSYSKMNNQDYLVKQLLKGEGPSIRLIKADLRGLILFDIAIVAFCMPFIINVFNKIRSIKVTGICSECFSKAEIPFVAVANLPMKKHAIRKFTSALRRGYLLNCSIENYDNNMKVALAKKIVKDQCPSCGAPIKGAVDSNYKCQYCDRIIMDVIKKK